MLDHIGLAVSDIDRSRPFYDRALAALGYDLINQYRDGDRTILMYGANGEPDFVIADGERPGEGNHVAFRADDRAQVDAFHAAALAAGGRDHGAPGLRDQYGPHYYAAFVLDPDGFNVEAVCHVPHASDSDASGV